MTRLTIIVLALASSTALAAGKPDLSQRPSPPPAPTWKAPVPESATTPAGTRVVVLPSHDLPIVHVLVTIRAGSALDPANKPGLAAATATMLDEGGAGTRTAPEVAQAFADIGAELEDHFDRDEVQLKLSVLSRNLDRALALLGDLIARPRFDAADWKRVQSRRVDEIRRRLDDPRHVADEVFERVIYGDHPYAHPFLGTVATVGAISADELRGFYRAHYGPRTIGFVLVGDTDARGAADAIARALGDWKSTAAPPPVLPAPRPQPARVVVVDHPNAPQSAVRVGALGLPRSTPDFAAAAVLETVLGGSFTSRLNQNLREKHGYVYGAFSHFEMRSVAGPFYCMYAARTDATAPALKETVGEIEGMRAPMSAAELDKGRALAEQAVIEAFSEGTVTAEELADLIAHGLPLDYWSKLPASLSSLTVPASTKIAQHLFPPIDQLTVVIVGDRKTIEPPLRLLPFVKSIEFRDVEGRVLH